MIAEVVRTDQFGDIPFFDREITPVPGFRYERLSPDLSHRAVEQSRITQGRKIFCHALLELGGVQEFQPGVWGIDYARFVKNPYKGNLTDSLIRELYWEMPTVGVVIAPENSGINPGQHLASIQRLPFVKVHKNDSSGKSAHRIAQPSFTQGEVKILSLNCEELARAIGTRSRSVAGMDDIIDEGTMGLSLRKLVELASEHEIFGAELIVLAALIEKTYTSARKRLNKAGIQVISGIQIEDLGVDYEAHEQWIKIPEIDEALSFSTPTPS